MSDTSTSAAGDEAGGAFKYGQRRIQLNVRLLMAKHGYKTVKRLFEDVSTMGCEVTYSQFARIVDNQAGKLNMEVLDALLNLFDCEVGELFIAVSA